MAIVGQFAWVSQLTSGVPPGACLLSSLDHIFGPPSIGSILDVDVAVALACSQPLISDNGAEFLERAVGRTIDERVVVKPFVRIHLNAGHRLSRGQCSLVALPKIL
jgi:hypothetical protein